MVDGALALIHSEREQATAIMQSDLAWCLGKLRGLGHPNEVMEKRYGLIIKEEGDKDMIQGNDSAPVGI